jgi:hypothetical protein
MTHYYVKRYKRPTQCGRLSDRVRHMASRGSGYAVPEPTTKADDRAHYRLGYRRKDTH